MQLASEVLLDESHFSIVFYYEIKGVLCWNSSISLFFSAKVLKLGLLLIAFTDIPA